jgi:hypothetical protein
MTPEPPSLRGFVPVHKTGMVCKGDLLVWKNGETSWADKTIGCTVKLISRFVSVYRKIHL